jgi:RimJ/RimL family protein N-acetyltransferase
MNLEFKRLTEIDKSEIIELMNNPLVRRHMPLTSDDFDDRDCDEFIAAKEKLWTDHGYGPWAFIVDGHFVGWGGLQPENGEADLGLVLHPKSWGIGKVLYDEILERAFGEMGFESVTVLLPPTRKLIKGLLQLGFKADGALEVGGERFTRYRLEKQVSEELQSQLA